MRRTQTRTWGRLAAAASLLAIGGLVTVGAGPDPTPESTTYGVAMADFKFQPTQLTVRQGDVIRFEQTGIQPHNVEFRKTPPGVDLGDKRMGPFLVSKGSTYEIRIDERFKPGVYAFVCTPHEQMGMKGMITVKPST